jgi:serine/threonine protein kinase
MPLPPALESEFELVEELPAGKFFQCYHVKERKAKKPRELLLRVLPASFNDNQSVIDDFHGFFLKLSHLTNRSNIPIVYSVAGAIGGPVYVLEQYVSGVSLQEYIESHRGSRILIDDLTEVVVRVCEALHFAHQKEICHCCITPDDILIDPENPRKVKLVGFGAQILIKTGHLDAISESLRKFLAPEILSGGVINRCCDIYSLAVALSEACSEIGLRRNLLARCQSKDPSQRPLSAREFGRELRKLADTANEPVVANESGALVTGGLNPVLTIKTDPTDAEVKANGIKLGFTTASGLMTTWKPGTILEIRKTGYSTETLDLTAPPDNTEIIVKLNSAVTIYTNPWGASVKVNGELLGITTYKGLTIPWDKGEIVIEKDGYNPQHFSYHAPPSDGDVSLELKPLKPITPFLDRRRLQLLGYGLSGLVVVLLVILIFGRSQNQDYEKRVSELQTQLMAKDAAIEMLTKDKLSEQRVKDDVESQLSNLQTQINQKDNEISRLTRTDHEKLQSQTELQKQLSDLRNQLRDKENDIGRLKTAPSQPTVATGRTNYTPWLRGALWNACHGGNVEEVRKLLRQGADPNSKMEVSGRTPLIIAVDKNHDAVVRVLLESGADSRLQDSDGWVPADYARLRNNQVILNLLHTYKWGS